MIKDEVLVEQLKVDYRQARLSPAQRVMLDYAAKLTQTPWAITEQDIKTLRNHHFSDRVILDINQIVGYFAYVNRLADGLGVPLEDFWEADATDA